MVGRGHANEESISPGTASSTEAVRRSIHAQNAAAILHERRPACASLARRGPSCATRTLRYKMDEPGRRPTILVVEDDPDLRLVHSEILSHEGYTVLAASDGVEALELVETEDPPAVILLDLRMPRMNGWDLAERLRRRPGWRDIPIVVVAAHYRIADEAAAIGARAWLHKPVSIDLLLRVVGQIYAESTHGGSS